MIIIMERQHILFVLQEANFSSRFLMVPVTEFMQVRLDDYRILVNAAQKNIDIEVNEEYHRINNLIIQTIENGIPKKTEYSDFCQDLLMYANLQPNQCFDTRDKIWFDISKSGICQCLNDIESYTVQK